MLERTLEQDVARRPSGPGGSIQGSAPPLPGQEEATSDQEDEDDVKGLESTDLVTQDAAYYEDEEDNDDLVDLGVQLGKLRITERVGGLVRPRLAEEVMKSLSQSYGKINSN